MVALVLLKSSMVFHESFCIESKIPKLVREVLWTLKIIKFLHFFMQIEKLLYHSYQPQHIIIVVVSPPSFKTFITMLFSFVLSFSVLRM